MTKFFKTHNWWRSWFKPNSTNPGYLFKNMQNAKFKQDRHLGIWMQLTMARWVECWALLLCVFMWEVWLEFDFGGDCIFLPLFYVQESQFYFKNVKIHFLYNRIIGKPKIIWFAPIESQNVQFYISKSN